MTEGTVHIIENDAAMGDSLAFLLDAAGFDVRLYEDAQYLLDGLQDIPNGCVLTDVRMAGIDGLELLQQIGAAGRKLPVIIMTGHGDVPLAVKAMKLGAFDFVEKPCEEEPLLSAIRAALQFDGGTVDPAVAAFLGRLRTLTGRERQVFDRLVAGYANKVIARDLAISPRTVEVHRATVMVKMGAASVSDLVRPAVKTGIA